MSFTCTVPPYWTPRGNRIHIIEKDCTTQQQCADKQVAYRTSCVRDWYLDWQCVECCTGDLCNFYVTVSQLNTLPLSFIIRFQYLGQLFQVYLIKPVSMSSHPQKLYLIWMQFGVRSQWVMHDRAILLLSKVKVTRPWKFEILTFSKSCLFSTIYKWSSQMTADSEN